MDRIKGNPSLADTFGLKAEYDYKQAKANFEKEETAAWEDFTRQQKEIEKNLKSTIAKANQAAPEGIDRDGLELLRSGIMTTEELGQFLDRYKDNPTMRRITAQHIKKMMEAADDPQDRQKLTMLYYSVERNDTMTAWDALVNTAHICSGQSHGRGSPSYTFSISSEWERLTEETIKNF